MKLRREAFKPKNLYLSFAKVKTGNQRYSQDVLQRKECIRDAATICAGAKGKGSGNDENKINYCMLE